MAFLAVNLEGRAFSLTLLAGSAPVPEWQLVPHCWASVFQPKLAGRCVGHEREDTPKLGPVLFNRVGRAESYLHVGLWSALRCAFNTSEIEGEDGVTEPACVWSPSEGHMPSPLASPGPSLLPVTSHPWGPECVSRVAVRELGFLEGMDIEPHG